MKSNSATLVFGIFLLIAVVAVQAQVNFSPAWGKRGTVLSQGQTREDLDHFSSQSLEDCKLPFDGVVRVLKLIQVEAQRLLKCQGISAQAAE